MEKRKFTLEVEKQLEHAQARGFKYLVTIYKKCALGEKRTFISYHYNIQDAKRAIKISPYQEFLVFHDLTLLTKEPEYFFIT